MWSQVHFHKLFGILAKCDRQPGKVSSLFVGCQFRVFSLSQSQHAARRAPKRERACKGFSGSSQGAVPKATATDPTRGRRIGEASHPGPGCSGDASNRRERTLHALAGLHICDPPASPACTVSDTLSENTPFATPRERRGCEGTLAVGGEVAPTAPGDATPGFTLPASPTAPAARQTALRPWSDARPPNGTLAQPSRGCSCRCCTQGQAA